MRKLVARVVAGLLVTAGLVLALSSYVFCASWYAEDEFQGLFDRDDAAFVEILAAAAILCCGVVVGVFLLRRRRGLAVILVAAAMLLSAAQIVLLETRSMCVSLPGLVRGSNRVMMVEYGK